MLKYLPPQAPMEDLREGGLAHNFEVLYATQHKMKDIKYCNLRETRST